MYQNCFCTIVTQFMLLPNYIFYSRLKSAPDLQSFQATFSSPQHFTTSTKMSADFSVPGTKPFKTRFENVEVPEKKLMFFLNFVKVDRLSDMDRQIHHLHVEAIKVKYPC